MYGVQCGMHGACPIPPWPVHISLPSSVSFPSFLLFFPSAALKSSSIPCSFFASLLSSLFLCLSSSPCRHVLSVPRRSDQQTTSQRGVLSDFDIASGVLLYRIHVHHCSPTVTFQFLWEKTVPLSLISFDFPPPPALSSSCIEIAATSS